MQKEGTPVTYAPFQGVVTPEAVLLEFETAGIGSRGTAAVIDLALRYGVIIFVASASTALQAATNSSLPSWVGVTFLTIVFFLLASAYSIIFETLWNGRTPGKALLGLRVVTTDGASINFRHAAVRGFIGTFEILLTAGTVAVIAAFLSPRSQRVGDYAAGTLVLRERSALSAPRALSFLPPPAAEPFAETLDVTSLGPEDYGAIRSFLVRSRELSGEARHSVGRQLARQYADQLRVNPPADMPPEVFLVCLASAYQRRFDRVVT